MTGGQLSRAEANGVVAETVADIQAKLFPAPEDPRMEPAQMALLLAKLTGVDGRQVDKTTVRAWWSLLGHLDFDACLAAIEPFYLRESRRMMPADFQEAVGGALDKPAWRPHV